MSDSIPRAWLWLPADVIPRQGEERAMILCDGRQIEVAASMSAPDAGIRAGCASLVRLPDGAEVLLRGALPEDKAGLVEMFFRLGDDTRYRYFFTGVPSTTHWAERFTALGVSDGQSSYALLAQVGADLVGLARFDRAHDNTLAAEVGILLVDGWQSRGLGRSMLIRLSEEARRLGITTFTGRILGENRRALALARSVFMSPHVAWAGEYEVTASLELKAATPDSDSGGT